MRYLKNSLAIQSDRDVPVLRQVRNSKFVNHVQLLQMMEFAGTECSRDSFGWRVRRLLRAGLLSSSTRIPGSESAVYRITRTGIALLEHHGYFTTVLHSRTTHLPSPSEIFHSLELNQIQLSLAKENVLANWQSEIEIASFNTISSCPYQKDYDAIVDVWIGDEKAQFALEYERSLKSCRHYDRIRAALEAEQKIERVLYLTSGIEVLTHVFREFRSIPKRLAFANARDFENAALDTRVVTAWNLAGLQFREFLE
jgi:hypothetical protein